MEERDSLFEGEQQYEACDELEQADIESAEEEQSLVEIKDDEGSLSSASDLSSAAYQTIASAAVQKITEDTVKSGDVKKGVIDTLAVATTIEAVNGDDEKTGKFREELKDIKQEEIKSSFQADKYVSDAKKAEAKRQKAEAFYKAFRPILEFDFSNITERERQNPKSYNDRSYGIAMMTLMLVIFTPFYILLSLVLMVCKSVNEVCKYVATFSKTAMRVCLWSFIICVAILVLYLIICWVEQRFGFSILH